MADFLGVGGMLAGCCGGDCIDMGSCCGDCCSCAMSDNGALGRRMPPSRGKSWGDCELGSRGMEKDDTAGELKEEGGADPEE